MSQFTERIQRDLAEIGDSATVSSTAWDAIQRRIETEDNDSVEILDLALVQDGPPASRRWMLAVAAVVLALIGVSLARTTNSTREMVSAVEQADEQPVEWSSTSSGPGVFATSKMQPGVGVTIGEGWVAHEIETVDSWSVRLPDVEHYALSRAVVWAVDVDASSPDDYIQDARARGFSFSDPTPVEIGGVPGQRYDLLGGALDLLPGTAGQWVPVSTPSEGGRVTVLDVEGRVVVVAELTPREPAVNFTASLALTAEIVDQITWLER